MLTKRKSDLLNPAATAVLIGYLVAAMIWLPCADVYAAEGSPFMFNRPVCAYDANHDGDIEESEYASCEKIYVCPDPGRMCNENHQCVVIEDPGCFPGGPDLFHPYMPLRCDV